VPLHAVSELLRADVAVLIVPNVALRVVVVVELSAQAVIKLL
jgi:hypothetical protein